jgi:hypothetical protein
VRASPSVRLESHPLWAAVDRVLDEMPPTGSPHAHGLGPIAAWRWREQGREVPASLEEISRRSGYGTVSVAPLLERIREAIDGPIVLIKGPEIAARYPRPALRPFGDLDLLVEDVERAERQLVAAGFDLVGPADHVLPGHHHDRPLRIKGLALAVELHRNPGWLNWQRAPANAEVFARAIPSVTGVAGIDAMPAVDHALLLSAHSWRHGPYHSWVHLIDIALAREIPDPDEIERQSRLWDLAVVWRLTNQAIQALFFDGEGWPGPIDRVWCRHLPAMRERTLLEYYAAYWLKGLAAPGLRLRTRAIAEDVRFSFRVHPWQTRSGKIERVGRALTRAFRPASQHRFR